MPPFQGGDTGSSPVGAKFVPSALNGAVKIILKRLYDQHYKPTVPEIRDAIIRERYAAGERLSDLAREYGISPQRVYQIVNAK